MDLSDLTPENRAEYEAWLQRCADDMLPKMKESMLSISIVDGSEPDPQFCMELGAAIMYDKPIVILSVVGARIPERLRSMAAGVVESSGDMLEDRKAVMAVLRSVIGET